MDNTLDKLARKYNTDKMNNTVGEGQYHGYSNMYALLFYNHRLEYKDVFEIGVRTGASHKMWHDYFPNATIYGIDTMSDPQCGTLDEYFAMANDRTKLYISDQTNEERLDEIFGDTTFDVIIDDGGHASWLHQKSFNILFPKLKPGGYYIIEDLATCFIPGYYDQSDPRSSTIEWLKSMQNGYPFSVYFDAPEYARWIESVEIVGELGIILKK